MNNETTTIQPFPKLPTTTTTKKVDVLAATPLQVLTIRLLAIIDILTGQVFMDALPLVGGETAKEELTGWMIKPGEEEGDNVYNPKKALSAYSTIALSAFGIGQTAQAHITKSQSDAVKGIFEVASMYENYRETLSDFAKTLRSKDLEAIEKLDMLWVVMDTLFDDFKRKVNENSKKDPESLENLVRDLNTVFIHLNKITEGAKMIQLIAPINNSNI